MTDRLDLPLRYRQQLEALLREHVPDAEVWAYGSRVNGTSHDASDLDLVLRRPDLERLDTGYPDLIEAIQESNIPILVQVCDWGGLTVSRRKEIQRRYVVFQDPMLRSGAIANEPADGWRPVALGEIADIFDGPHATPKKTERGPVFLGISNLVNGRIDLSATRHLSENDYLAWTRRITPKQGDIVFSYETRLGEAAAIPNGLRCCLGRRMGLLRARTGVVDPRFLLYAYLGPTFQETLRSRAVPGSTVDRIPLSEMGSFPMHIPVDLGEQQAIAGVLGTLDDKIELNRRMNETLEQMARALFKSWFVDFEPVRAKMEGRWRAGQSLPGLPAHLHDLFPSRLAPSELGEIPAGWEVTPLDGIADFLNGLAMQKYPAVDGKALPVIKIAQLRVGSTAGADLASADIPNQYAINDGDVLFSWSGSLELDTWTGGPGALNQHLFKVTSNKYPKWFFYQWITHHMPVFREIAAGKATTMGHIRRHHLSEAATLTPSHKLLREMNVQMEPLFQRGLAIRIESRALAAQRDALLPKLVSGKVRTGGQSGSLQMRLSVTRSKESRDRWK